MHDNGGAPTPVLLKRDNLRSIPEDFLGDNYESPEHYIEDGARILPRAVQGHYESPEYYVKDEAQTPPRAVQGHYEVIPLAEGLPVTFRHADESTTFQLSDIDHALYEEARTWFKSKIRTSTELIITEMRKTHFQEEWIHFALPS
ncbi:hypothetical protein BGX27_003170 [Mortierella sp. AM989]|nr:hypothetical protein BGX27_003170 [Mortierella sp. AM989]